MRIARTKPFLKQYVKLPLSIRKKADRQIINLAQDIRHPAVNAKKMTGVGDIWEARVDRQYRMTFQIQDDIIILRKVGTHEIYRNP